ncbi:putative cytochrome P450 [Microdochium bolleyi]|uniref:Putative cytochrome P450 n=1 Tax=Microdochium bolleyi TaxID=196109 RepID=A0A136IRF8_9PEZI|nr:putative cytochrome P450 [Microdochium bolleyi]
MIADALSSPQAWSAVAVVVAATLLLRPQKEPFPTINKYSGDLLNKKAYAEAQNNARGLVRQGLEKHNNQPFAIAIPHGLKIVLPASLGSWVKSKRELDHVQLVRDDFFSGLPGFESQTVLHSPDEFVKRMITTKLGQNDSTTATMNASMARAFDDLWGGDDATSWHAIDWQKDTMGIIARAASSVFVGPELAEDPEWSELVQSYVTSYFMACGDLHKWPVWSRSLVHWFLPNASACRKELHRARAVIDRVVRERQEAVDRANAEGSQPPEYNDALAWSKAAPDSSMHPADIQLALAMAALFTTTELFRQVLIDVSRHPEIMEPLRDEVRQQISAHGTSVAATSNMVLLDSVLKESQRLSAGPVVTERAALKDVALPDGRVIPRGAHIMVDSTQLWDSRVYPDASKFDGHRFLRMREAGDKTSGFVQTSPEFLVFGAGRHICPGRFFASNELKLAMAHALLKYDIMMDEECSAEPMMNGFFAIVNPMVQLRVRRRTEKVGFLS